MSVYFLFVSFLPFYLFLLLFLLFAIFNLSFFSPSHSLFSNMLFLLPSFPASCLSLPSPPTQQTFVGYSASPLMGPWGCTVLPWLGRDVQPSGRWPCEQQPCSVMRVIREGCAWGSGVMGEEPRSLCWSESVTTKKIYLPWNYHHMESLVFCIFT